MSFGDRDGAPVSEEIVFRAAQERLPDDWYVFHSFHFTSDDLQGRRWCVKSQATLRLFSENLYRMVSDERRSTGG